jgi:large subunit ribosomal protein L35
LAKKHTFALRYLKASTGWVITGCAYCPNGSISSRPCGAPAGCHDKRKKMPKVKTNSSAKKRFKVTGTGKITYQKAFKRHILTKKSTKRKRNLREKGTISSANLDFVKRLLRLK